MELHQALLMKVTMTIFMIAVIITFAVAIIQMGEKNDFQQYATLQIERHGGLTSEAISLINEYSTTNYNGRFVITSEPTGKVEIFDSIKYTYTMNIQPLLFDWDIISLNLEGHATSLVR